MQKAALLRAHLVERFAWFTDHPKDLRMFVESGSVDMRAGSRGFQISYQLQVVFYDWTHHAAVAMLAVNDWLAVNEPDVILPTKDPAYSFQADIIDETKSDLKLTVALTELAKIDRNEDDTGDVISLLAPDIEGDNFLQDLPLTGEAPAAPLQVICWEDERLIPHPEKP